MKHVRRARLARTGRFLVPSPEIFWMQRFLDLDELWLSSLLLETDDHLVVVNTGLPEDPALYQQTVTAWDARAELQREDGEHITDVLASWGVAPEDVDTVLLSPLAPYACGGVPLFPRAQVCMSRAGLAHLFAPPRGHDRPPPAWSLTPETLQWLLGEGWTRTRLLDDEEEVVPGVRTFRSGVHHVSSLAVLFEADDETVCYSDSFFRYANVEANTPLGIGRSLDEAYATYDRVRREADVLLPAYDPAAWERHPGGVLV